MIGIATVHTFSLIKVKNNIPIAISPFLDLKISYTVYCSITNWASTNCRYLLPQRNYLCLLPSRIYPYLHPQHNYQFTLWTKLPMRTYFLSEITDTYTSTELQLIIFSTELPMLTSSSKSTIITSITSSADLSMATSLSE